MTLKVRASIEGGDEVELRVEVENNQVSRVDFSVVGRLELIQAVENLKERIKGPVAQISIPSGTKAEDLLLKELILKLQSRWPDQAPDPELCHCRRVSQTAVERAVILGAHTLDKVRRCTSANTGCGTCLPEVQRILELYLKKQPFKAAN